MKVEISEESYQFLKELACRIDTQDNRATAKPYFFVVKKPRWYPAHPDYSSGGSDTKYVRLTKYDEVDEYSDDDDGKAEFIKAYKERYDDREFTEEQLDDAWDNLEVCKMEEREEEEDNAFLTFKGYEEHVRLNRHNLGKHHSYLKHAYRNPEMDSLFKAIAEFKEL